VLEIADKSRDISYEIISKAHEATSREHIEAARGPDASSIGITVNRVDNHANLPRLRVLHVIDRLDVGGTECGIVKVIEGLSGDSFEHRICTVRGFNEKFLKEHGLGNKVYVAGRSTSGFQFLLGRLARIMREFRPHVVHSRNWGAIEAIPAARLARVPVAIHSEHGYEVDMLAGLPTRRRIIRRIAYAAADAVFTVTEELRDYHARQAWVSAARIRVLPNGVDTIRFARRSGERDDVRGRLGVGGERIVLGCVGRMVPIKDHRTLLQAAETLIGRGLPVHLLLVGSGPELTKHQEFVRASPILSGRTIFVGSTAEVPSLLNAMDVFVLPSLSEGMSNTLLEAMASSLPTIATNVGGNPELIEDGSSGWLFQPGDVTGLTDRLERLIRDPNLRQALGESARKRVDQHFSLGRMILRYRDLYLDLARKRNILTAHWE
jgi:sugar transferase (PEP-CTERM/EpsH1 system associated)